MDRNRFHTCPFCGKQFRWSSYKRDHAPKCMEDPSVAIAVEGELRRLSGNGPLVSTRDYDAQRRKGLPTARHISQTWGSWYNVAQRLGLRPTPRFNETFDQESLAAVGTMEEQYRDDRRLRPLPEPTLPGIWRQRVYGYGHRWYAGYYYELK